MTNPSKINDLTAASALSSTMQLETDIGGVTANKITVDQLNTYIKSTNGIFCIAAGGTVDAITATYTPAVALYDTLFVAFVSTGVNVTTTPTFAYNGGTARTITSRGGLALRPGDIGAAGFVAMLEYNLANTRWELLNPVNTKGLPCVAGGGTVDAITATYTPTVGLFDTLTCSFVSAGANATATPTFAYNGGTARTITARGGQALRPGDIGAAGYVGLLEYNLANTRWELLNPVGSTTLFVSNSTVNNVTTGETDLITYTMPAGVFTNTGARLRYRVRGAWASSVNAKTLKIYFGSTVITSQSLPISLAGSYTALIEVTRTGVNTQSISFEFLRNGASSVPAFTAPAIVAATETEANTIVLKCTGTGGASNEISQYYGAVDIL